MGVRRYRHISQGLFALKRVASPKYEREVSALPQLVKTGDIVFEIGANYAQYSRVLSKLVGSDGRIYAFEPAEITFKYLMRNCRLLHLRNVCPYKLALSEKIGEMTFYTPIRIKGKFGIETASLAPDPNKDSIKEKVQVDTIDNFVATHNINRIAFIRCDVEGSEMGVFLGACHVLETHRPNVLLEVHPIMITRFGHSVLQLQEYFHSLKYHFSLWQDGRFRRTDEMVKGNVFCIPMEREPIVREFAA